MAAVLEADIDGETNNPPPNPEGKMSEMQPIHSRMGYQSFPMKKGKHTC